MDAANLGNLPGHLLLDVIDYLDTARDVSHLGSCTRHMRDLIHHDGWKSFVRNMFPSLAIPSSGLTTWASVADRLTYLDRCWEKRGFAFNLFREDVRRRGRHRIPPGGQSVTFQCFVDVQLLSSQAEVLACGTGEDLLVRWRAAAPESNRSDTWRKLGGRDTGYSAGSGDVTAVSVIERDCKPEVLLGRANGDVQLLAGANDEAFGRTVKRLLAAEKEEAHNQRSSPGRLAVTWTEWQPETHLVASCGGSRLTLHNLSSEGEETTLKPIAYYDASKAGDSDEMPLVRCAKFMGRDGIVCGIGNNPEPLRWGKIRPTGVELSSIPCYSAAEAFPTKRETVRAIEQVGNSTNENLLLSAWDDGSYRLLDIRTPSNRDVVYRDRFQPYCTSSSLLVYGTERFVAGGNSEAVLRIFDFRYPKPYLHFNALHCSDQSPCPEAPEIAHARLSREGRQVSAGLPNQEPATPFSSRCEPGHRRVCRWHGQSRLPDWRPDATVFLGTDADDRVFSLAKASDLSDSFYCGLRGAIVEATPILAEDVHSEAAKPPAPPGWVVRDARKKPFGRDPATLLTLVASRGPLAR
ncbi:F-box domain, cyclin-like protein [Hirsutella rhossiliensis]|uniref:F-box domain, cyclin-like protein n=1 Tax=Hirsutella rhossiliensis TaxID=111463 RepID=A0A9P8MUV3_9HYPO|nr:F-box domain, cyclin-like protein [Hirsutella rhossiliensis]KAH0961650.1 F-box domain, cyclin-like protein [Hirsutella rhossiliensis]